MIDNPLNTPATPPMPPPSPADPQFEIQIEGEDTNDLLDAASAIIGSLTEEPFDANLAESLDDSFLTSLASDLIHDIDEDLQSRSDWEKTIKDGLKLLGLSNEERSEPWEGASGVSHPLITEAAIRFQSEMIAETFPAMGPVKAKVVGETTRQIDQAAQRVVDDMNYHLTEKMSEFRPEHERMLWNEALVGSGFKKVYFDESLGRPVSVFVPAEDFIVPYGASDLLTTPRATHRQRKYKNDIRKLQVSGYYLDTDIGEPAKLADEFKQKIDKVEGYDSANDDRFTIYELCVHLDIPGDRFASPDGIEIPYVVTLLKDANKILAIRRNWEEEDELKTPRQHYVHYIYIPGFGFYGLGLLHLLGNYASAATSIIRQLVDAGTLSNLPGGLKTIGLRIKNDDTPIGPGEWRDVDIASGTVRDNIMPLPYKEPSQVLAALLDKIVEEGRRLASTVDVKLNEMNGEMPVGTTLAILERTLKVMSAIQARNHTSMAQEFKLVANLIKNYTAPYYSFPTQSTGASTFAAKREDYEMTDIIPVSDPNASTMAQRIIQYQAAVQLAQQAPQVYDLPLLHLQMLRVMGIKDAEKIVKTTEDLQPTDPVSENMCIITNSPAKAFIEQDHQAHIAVHQSFINDPQTAQMMQQNPQAQAIMQAFQAHLMEHYGFQYRQQLEQQLGMMLPPPGSPFSPQEEHTIGPLLAQGAQQLNQLHAAQQQTTQAQQQMQDPLYQQQMMELQLKKQDIDNRHQIELAKLQTQMEIARLNNQTKIHDTAVKVSAGHQTEAAGIIERSNKWTDTAPSSDGPPSKSSNTSKT